MADKNTFFKSLLRPLEGLDEAIFVQTSDYPIPCALEAVLGEEDACHLVFHLGVYIRRHLPGLDQVTRGGGSILWMEI
jgi:hypothetical protein